MGQQARGHTHCRLSLLRRPDPRPPAGRRPQAGTARPAPHGPLLGPPGQHQRSTRPGGHPDGAGSAAIAIKRRSRPRRRRTSGRGAPRHPVVAPLAGTSTLPRHKHVAIYPAVLGPRPCSTPRLVRTRSGADSMAVCRWLRRESRSWCRGR